MAISQEEWIEELNKVARDTASDCVKIASQTALDLWDKAGPEAARAFLSRAASNGIGDAVKIFEARGLAKKMGGLVGDSIDFDEDTPPDWCPLREGPVTLRLR